jgi:Concanavalin A-like lectin/glucanases superfamily
MTRDDQATHTEPRPAAALMRLGFKIAGGALVLCGSFFATLYVMDRGVGIGSKWTGPTAQFVYDAKSQPALKPPFDIPNAAISQSFAFRMRLVPAEQQTDYAALFSSHTGDNRGFAILHKPDVPDGYIAVVGNGIAFWFSEPFIIPHGQESELLVAYNNGDLRVSVNHKAVIEKTGLGPIVPAAVPVTIGDWQLGDRKFNGDIREVDFFKDA